MEGYTDIHCHVLPEVDDGARDMQQALDMLVMMYDEGIDNVILTPHYHKRHMETDAGRIKRQFDRLCAAAAEDEIASQLDLYLGSEIYYYPSVPEWLDEGRVFTLAGSRYVLLEFGFTMDKRMIFDGVQSVVRAGYIPVIAHVERYEGLEYKTSNVEELVNMGALIQINSEVFESGHKVKSFAKKMLKQQLVHFVATDAHDTKGRAPRLDKAAAYIEKHYGGEYRDRLFFYNPFEIIGDQHV